MKIKGSAGHDRLYGTTENDVIRGRRGDDSINGLPGNDVLFGGKGSDQFIFGLNKYHDGDKDRIMDFQSGEDQIYIASNPKHVDIRITDHFVVIKGGNNKIKIFADDVHADDLIIL